MAYKDLDVICEALDILTEVGEEEHSLTESSLFYKDADTGLSLRIKDGYTGIKRLYITLGGERLMTVRFFKNEIEEVRLEKYDYDILYVLLKMLKAIVMPDYE